MVSISRAGDNQPGYFARVTAGVQRAVEGALAEPGKTAMKAAVYTLLATSRAVEARPGPTLGTGLAPMGPFGAGTPAPSPLMAWGAVDPTRLDAPSTSVQALVRDRPSRALRQTRKLAGGDLAAPSWAVPVAEKEDKGGIAVAKTDAARTLIKSAKKIIAEKIGDKDIRNIAFAVGALECGYDASLVRADQTTNTKGGTIREEFGIFRNNLDMLQQLKCPPWKIDKIRNGDVGLAAEYFLKAFHKWGRDGALLMNRGGGDALKRHERHEAPLHEDQVYLVNVARIQKNFENDSKLASDARYPWLDTKPKK